MGQWRLGTKHGLGVMEYSDGSVYEGKWAHNQREGQGKYWYSKGQQLIEQEGTWLQDELVTEATADQDQEEGVEDERKERKRIDAKEKDTKHTEKRTTKVRKAQVERSGNLPTDAQKKTKRTSD